MFPKIKAYCDEVIGEFNLITRDRILLLDKLAEYIKLKKRSGSPVQLVYICTHNSRRSHFGQIWSTVATSYHGMTGIKTYSGGTEITAFNSNAVRALERAGFRIKTAEAGVNTVYELYYDETLPPLTCYSKVYDDPRNPGIDFAAVMTCGEAEDNCPFIPGAEIRIATTYEDPKVFDNTPLQDQKYDERCRQIARETMYVFAKAVA